MANSLRRQEPTGTPRPQSFVVVCDQFNPSVDYAVLNHFKRRISGARADQPVETIDHVADELSHILSEVYRLSEENRFAKQFLLTVTYKMEMGRIDRSTLSGPTFSPEERNQLYGAFERTLDFLLGGNDSVEVDPALLPIGVSIAASLEHRNSVDSVNRWCVTGNGTQSPVPVWPRSSDQEPEDSQMPKNVDEVQQLVVLLKELMPRIDALVESNSALLKRIVSPSHTPPEPDLSLLTEEQRKVFTAVDAIPGHDAAARRKVQSELSKLKGQKITEALGRLLTQTLRDRGWGVRCSCGEAAQFAWQKNRHCAEGGLLALSHKTRGKQHIHDSSTVFLDYALIEKPDRRAIPKR